jgi:hypothetical protein
MLRSHLWKRHLVALCTLSLSLPAAACGQAGAIFEPVGSGELRVLFIGNSLTEYNDLPGMLESLLADAGLQPTIVSLARPATGLMDHWELPSVHHRIADGWDVVVLQQGPSATEGRPSLLEYSERFAPEIRAAGAVPAMYMVWPAESRSFDFPGVSDSYSDAADLIDGLLFPAGEAWLDAWNLDADVPLYGGDRFHPSPLGSYLAALVMYEQLTGLDPRAVTSDIPGFSGAATPVQLDVLREAARQANADHRR